MEDSEPYSWEQAPNPQYNLRTPKGQNISARLGIPGSLWEQMAANNKNNPRDEYIKKAYSKWNPQWDKTLENVPRSVRKNLQKMRDTGMGSEISRKFMQDPLIQEALQANGMQEAIAMERMYSYGGSLGSKLLVHGGRVVPPADPQSIIGQHNLRMEGTQQFQKALFDQIYTRGNKIMPEGNPDYTNGMRPSDVINLASYASKYGGVMSTMDFRKDDAGLMQEMNVGDKLQHVRQMTAGIGEFMKITGAKNLTEALGGIRRTEGREYAQLDPEAFARKMRNVSDYAASSNTGANTMLEMMARSKGRLDAMAGRGPGSGYEGGNYLVDGVDKNGNRFVDFRKAYTSEEGMSARLVQKALALADIRGISDKNVQMQMADDRTTRMGDMMNTAGGRAIELAVKLRGAGKLTEKGYASAKEALLSGVGVREAVDAMSIESGMPLRKIIYDDTRYNAEMYKLNSDINRHSKDPSLTQAQMGSDIVDMNEIKNRGDSRKAQAQAGAKGTRELVDNLARTYGVKFTPEENTAMGREAMAKMYTAMEDPTFYVKDETMRKKYLDKIGQGISQGVSVGTMAKRLGRMGIEGAEMGSLLETEYQRQKHESILASEPFNKGLTSNQRRQLGDDMTQAGIKNGFGQGDRITQQNNARNAINQRLEDTTRPVDIHTRNILNDALSTLDEATAPKSNQGRKDIYEHQRKVFNDASDAADLDRRIGRSQQQREEGGEGAEGDVPVTRRADKTANVPDTTKPRTKQKDERGEETAGSRTPTPDGNAATSRTPDKKTRDRRDEDTKIRATRKARDEEKQKARDAEDAKNPDGKPTEEVKKAREAEDKAETEKRRTEDVEKQKVRETEDTKAKEDKKPEDKKPEDKKPEDKKPEDKKPEDKKPKPADEPESTKTKKPQSESTETPKKDDNKENAKNDRPSTASGSKVVRIISGEIKITGLDTGLLEIKVEESEVNT